MGAAHRASPRGGALGSFYGLSSLAWAVGGALGNTLGGWISQQETLGVLPWLSFMVIGFVVALATRPKAFGRDTALAAGAGLSAAGKD